MDTHIGFFDVLRRVFPTTVVCFLESRGWIARRPCATEVQDHLICGDAGTGLIVVYQAVPALTTGRRA